MTLQILVINILWKPTEFINTGASLKIQIIETNGIYHTRELS